MKEVYSEIISLCTLVHTILDVEPDGEALSQETLSSTMVAFSLWVPDHLSVIYPNRVWWHNNQIPKIILKSAGFSGIFCVHAPTLKRGCCYQYPVISQNQMGRPPRDLPTLSPSTSPPPPLLTCQVLFWAPHFSLEVHKLHWGVSSRSKYLFPK